jgi:hypothetical protein
MNGEDVMKDEGGRMKDENNLTGGMLLPVFIVHPSSFILCNPMPNAVPVC